jgi:hypothetical protein
MCVYKAPANFIIPNLSTKFPFSIWYENTRKIPKGSYRNTESVYNSNLYMFKEGASNGGSSGSHNISRFFLHAYSYRPKGSTQGTG